MPALIQFGLAEFLIALTILGLLAAATTALWYAVRGEKRKVKTNTIEDLTAAYEALQKRVGVLDASFTDATIKHERCERKLNRIVAFNLRLQAREMRYQKTINHLERIAGLDQTDFNDVTEAPDADFNS